MPEQSTDWGLLSSYAGLLSVATLSIYHGSFSSLPTPKRSKDDKDDDEWDTDESEDEDDEIDRFSSTDAYMFPVLGSVVLFGLYFVIKNYGKEWVNWFLGWYFTIAGVGSVWRASIYVTKALLGPDKWRKRPRYRFLVLKGRRQIRTLSLRGPSLLLFPLSMIPSILYSNFYSGAATKPVLLTNILAVSFALNAISLLKLDTFRTGCVMLSGLFLYDVWWVFGTEVMVKVAVSLDLPIKILWPKALPFLSSASSSERANTMLGLGDIVVPGLFVSLALRYDFARSKHNKRSARTFYAFRKNYFWAALSAYVGGLVTTMAVMHIWGHAQPALLYLSPACILSFFVTSLVRGEFKQAWAWVDEPQTSQSKSEKEVKKGEEPTVSGVEDVKSAAIPRKIAQQIQDAAAQSELSASYVDVAARAVEPEDGSDAEGGDEAEEDEKTNKGRKRKAKKRK